MRTNLRPCERSDRALYALCLFANPLYLYLSSITNKVYFVPDGQRETSKGNSIFSITAQGIMHRASRPEPIVDIIHGLPCPNERVRQLCFDNQLSGTRTTVWRGAHEVCPPAVERHLRI
jgi:hypothetical protein